MLFDGLGQGLYIHAGRFCPGDLSPAMLKALQNRVLWVCPKVKIRPTTECFVDGSNPGGPTRI